jgi:hypothetical protein
MALERQKRQIALTLYRYNTANRPHDTSVWWEQANHVQPVRFRVAGVLVRKRDSYEGACFEIDLIEALDPCPELRGSREQASFIGNLIDLIENEVGTHVKGCNMGKYLGCLLVE